MEQMERGAENRMQEVYVMMCVPRVLWDCWQVVYR